MMSHTPSNLVCFIISALVLAYYNIHSCKLKNTAAAKKNPKKQTKKQKTHILMIPRMDLSNTDFSPPPDCIATALF